MSPSKQPMPDSSPRPATHADADAIAALSGELGYPSASADVRARLAAIGQRTDEAVLAAEDDRRRVVGWAHVFTARRIESEAFAELGGLVASRDVQRRGVGRRLVEASQSWARERGLRQLRVRSNVVRAAAHAFYAQLGYETLETQAVFALHLRTGER